MTTLPKLWKLLSIAVLLIGISRSACLAETQTPLPPKRFQMLLPNRHKCLDLLELERLKVDPRTNTITYDTYTERRLAADYIVVVGWFQGFFTAVNITQQTDGDVTKETTTPHTMAWTFSYCRAHPSENLVQAALELLNALRRDSTTRK
jgi:hypothetical protein